MKLSLAWIQEVFGAKLETDKLTQQLVSLGLEVDDIDGDIIEISIPANRGDCLSVYGICRELATIYDKNVDLPTPKVNEDFTSGININIDDYDRCARYVGIEVRGVDNSVSTPSWMVSRLEASGVQSISPIVDITNYVMLEMGQPLHAFDRDKLNGNINVKVATSGEKLELLDSSTINLSNTDLLICDDASSLALAGIMGGGYSGVVETTKNIFIESAWFSPVGVRLSARAHKLQTESSYRFERSVDYNEQLLAARRVAELVIDICGGESSEAVINESIASLPKKTEVEVPITKINEVLGSSHDESDVASILEKLNFNVTVSDNVIKASAPSYRQDIQIPEDVIEEVARVASLDSIPVVIPKVAFRQEFRAENNKAKKLQTVRNKLSSIGFSEVVCYSFISPEYAKAFNAYDNVTKVLNPISEDLSVMRTSLWPGLIKSLVHNVNRQHKHVKLFECGKSFNTTDEGVLEEVNLVSGLLWGTRTNKQWGHASCDADLYDLKGDLDNLLSMLKAYGEIEYKGSSNKHLHPGKSADIMCEGTYIGCFGELHPVIAEKLGVPEGIYLFELQQDILVRSTTVSYQGVSKYPSVSRDINLIVGSSTNSKDVIDSIIGAAGDILKSVEVADIFTGKGIASGTRSITYTLNYQLSDRTLTDDEIQANTEQVLSNLKAELGIELRS